MAKVSKQELKSEAELADKLFANRRAEGEWSEERTPVDVRMGRTSVVSFRLPTDELEALDEAAGAANETISGYVRKALALRRRTESFFVLRREDAIGANVLLSAPNICVWEKSTVRLLEPPSTTRSLTTKFDIRGWVIPLEEEERRTHA